LTDLIESVTVDDESTVSFRFRRPVRLPETYFQSLPILPWHKFTVLQPSLLDEPNLGMVRTARVQVAVFTAPDDAQPAGWNIEAGVQLSVMRSEKDWAEVKVIAGGPAGKSGWIRQHRVQLNETDDAKLMTQAVGTGPYKLESFLKDDMVSLVRFEDYHGRKPYIAEIRWRELSRIRRRSSLST
jgi:ABC-type transport system substrate-binding protein